MGNRPGAAPGVARVRLDLGGRRAKAGVPPLKSEAGLGMTHGFIAQTRRSFHWGKETQDFILLV